MLLSFVSLLAGCKGGDSESLRVGSESAKTTLETEEEAEEAIPQPETEPEEIDVYNDRALDWYWELRRSLDPERPGFGLEYPGYPEAESAMAYGHIAQSAALIGDYETMQKAGRWLLENSGVEEMTGWGLSFAWDSYRDGSVNPETTVYAITTAIAVDALTDIYCVTGQREYILTAIDALDYYLNFLLKDANDDFFLYSDQLDSNTNTHNINAMLSLTYARVGVIAGRQDFINVASGVVGSLASAIERQPGNITWRYSALPYESKYSFRNDLVHAAYISYGLNEAQHYLGIDLIEENDLRVYMDGFQSGDVTTEFRLNETLTDEETKRRSRGWGLGMYIAWLVSINDFERAEEIIETIEDYRLPEGKFAYIYGDDLSLPRSTSHLMYGAASLAVGKTSFGTCS
ncbi:MAG TPA: hypothetical protein QF776_07350 [Acidimicrobiales bacterium]|nr:hypothetical protein [Acidimicrobiales bacterium]